MNDQNIREVKDGIRGFVKSLERLKGLLGQEVEAHSALRSKTVVVTAFHKVQVCTDQNITALIELDMVLQDMLDESGPGARTV